MPDRLIKHLSSSMVSGRVGSSPSAITRAVRRQTVATTRDLERTSSEDLKAAARIGPHIAVAAARGAEQIGASLETIVPAIMKGLLEGIGQIGGPQEAVARQAAGALLREAVRQGADLTTIAPAIIAGMRTADPALADPQVTEAAIEGLRHEAATIGSETEQVVRSGLPGPGRLSHQSGGPPCSAEEGTTRL